MVVDTPIVDREVRENIGDESSIIRRLERAEIFRNYLDSQWINVEAAAEVFNWKHLSSQLNDEINLIKRSLGVGGPPVGTIDVQ